MKTQANEGTGQYVFYGRANAGRPNISYSDFFINAKDDGSVDNQASIQKYNGNFFFNSGKLFMHLTNSDSYINGNLELQNDASIVSFSTTLL